MPAKTKRPAATIDAIRRQLAEVEAEAGRLRAKLAKMEAVESGNPEPVCGLDLLWEAALPISRQRSSRQKCRVAWARLPAAARPTIARAVAALAAWNKCKQWYVDDHAYALGLDRFISNRMWEDLPVESKTVAPLHRNMSASPKPTPVADAVKLTPEETAHLLGIKPKPAALPKPNDSIHGPAEISAMLSLMNLGEAFESGNAQPTQ